jgi:hypothetical protein
VPRAAKAVDLQQAWTAQNQRADALSSVHAPPWQRVHLRLLFGCGASNRASGLRHRALQP